MKNHKRQRLAFALGCFLLLSGSVALSTREAHAFNESVTTDEILYSVKPDGTLWWQTDTITTKPIEGPNVYTALVEHKLGTPVQVGEGWDTPLDVLPGGGGTIYVERTNGNLEWFYHAGFLDGKPSWKTLKNLVGTGWNNAKVIPMGDGVLYSIMPDGTLRWNKHKTYRDPGEGGYGGWVQPSRDVSSGWNKFKTVFGGGNGVFYVVTSNGDLYWYRHKAYLDPLVMPAKGTGMVNAAQRLNWAKNWEGPKKIGNGWGDFKRLFCAGNGHIYAIKSTGELDCYHHTAWQTGDDKWGTMTKVSDGWGDFVFTFAAMPANN